jgi:hypothetical protein
MELSIEGLIITMTKKVRIILPFTAVVLAVPGVFATENFEIEFVRIDGVTPSTLCPCIKDGTCDTSSRQLSVK